MSKQTSHHHNTTNLKGLQLFEAIETAKTHEQKVLELFKIHSKLTASQVYTMLKIQSPITSIRRAISNLKQLQLLKKLDGTAKGMYGKPEHFYKLIKN